LSSPLDGGTSVREAKGKYQGSTIFNRLEKRYCFECKKALLDDSHDLETRGESIV
jgi:hypothetical protein